VNPRSFVPFFVGRILSTLGRQMLSVAVGWDLYDRTGSFLVLGLVGLAQVTPVVLLAVPAGHAVDRFDARKTGAFSCALLSLTGAGFAVATKLDAPIAAMFALLVVHGTAMAFHAPSVSSILPRLVERDERARANAVMSTGFELASIGGPGLAGLLLAATKGAFVVYCAEAALTMSFAGVLAWLYVSGLGAATATAKSSSFEDMIVGVKFVFSSRLLLPAMTLDLFAVLFGGVTALLPAFAKDILHEGPEGLGALRAAPAAGALVMAIISTKLKAWDSPGRALFAAIAVFGAATLGFGLSKNLWLSCALLAIAGAADNVSVVIRMTLEQMITPDELRGRVSSVRYVFIGMSNELGELESGLVAAAIGAVPSVVVGCVVCFGVLGLVRVVWPELWKLGPLAQLAPRAIDSSKSSTVTSAGTTAAPR
jgi:MFS family permease